ncbi:MAG: ribonuclease J [Parcubacteria group bacterium Athens1014_10]|nr:MAG: ribonuclease J [Parcubacteria group bacterium Athens1014_10]TSD04688.1 MAG: ribonuclease J [Parcubacteria group bacterium Athens0714_12]
MQKNYYKKPHLASGLPKSEKLKIIPLGGMEEVGRNMMLIEYGNDIVIIDMGLQFPEEDMPGIDFIIPDISYLRDKLNKIRGVIITHGHYDHIGAIPYLASQLGNPIIFGTQLTLALIRKRQDEFKDKPNLNLQVITHKDRIKLGCFEIEFFRVSHNIPDCVGVIVHTPEGIIIHTGDFKIDLNPADGMLPDLAKMANLGEQNVLALLADSTNANQKGHQFSEKEIGDNLEQILAKAKGRIIIATFSSLLSRLQQVFWMAEKLGRKVAIEGYSMKINVETASQLGYIKVKRGTIIGLAEALRLPKDKIIIACTGAQGEDRAVLMRIANEEHRQIRIESGDTVIFSSSVVPGNERTVQKLKDSLYRKGAEVVHYQMVDIHAGGHAKQEDLKLTLRLINPRYLMPIEGNTSLLRAHAKVAEEIGFDPRNILLVENGQVVEFSRSKAKITDKKVPTDYIMVDGLGVGDVSNIVLRDRRVMSQDGMIVIIATVDNKTGNLVTSPDIISRGFVYMRESKELIEQARSRVRKLLHDHNPNSQANETYLKNKIRDEIGQFLFKKTQRRPMVIPVIIGV